MDSKQIEMEEVKEIKPERKKVTAGQVFGIIGNVCKWLLFAILVFIIVMNVSNLYKVNVKKEKVPTFLGIGTVRVIGNSMSPTLKIGDMIVIVHKNSYKVGDIITFIDKDGVTVTHRVKEIREDGTYVTAGDYTGSPDSQFLNNKDIVGKVVLRLKGFGYVMDFFQTIWGVLIIIIIGFMIIELPYLIKYIKEKKEKERIEKRIDELKGSQSGSDGSDAGENIGNIEDLEARGNKNLGNKSRAGGGKDNKNNENLTVSELIASELNKEYSGSVEANLEKQSPKRHKHKPKNKQ